MRPFKKREFRDFKANFFDLFFTHIRSRDSDVQGQGEEGAVTAASAAFFVTSGSAACARHERISSLRS